MSKTRIIFMGTPDYAVPALETLARHPVVSVELVVTQPDRPRGRGRKLQSPLVKVAADRLRLPTLQVASLKSAETRERLAAYEPDLIVVAAFGIILGPKTLNLPRLGCINLHASLLPSYRGANPVAAAIAMGEEQTGVTLMQMDRGLDTGPVLDKRGMVIGPVDTTASLTDRLARLAADLLSDSLNELIRGNLKPIDQGEGGSLTRPMTKNDGWIDWSRPAIEIERHIRAMSPWPTAWSTRADGSRLQIHRSHIESASDDSAPGTISVSGKSLLVATGGDAVGLDIIQLPGGKPIEGKSLLDRLRGAEGNRLGLTGQPEPSPPLIVPV